jgi:hypothetical protein
MSRARQIIAGLVCAGALVLAGCSRPPSAQETKAWDAELRRLQTEQDSLRARAAAIVAADPRIQRLPQGDVVLSVPTQFIRDLVERVFDDVASHVTLRLAGIKAHVKKSVKKVVKIGDFTVDVNIQQIIGKLQPQKPTLTFRSTGIQARLPVEVNQGTGRAQIHFVWDGKNVAGMACGDLDVTKTVSGNVIPASYLVAGSLDLAMKGKQVVCTPRFPETRVQIRVKPSKASWASIDSLLAQYTGLCGYVLEKVNVPNILTNVVQEKGFSVKLPLGNLKPFVIPAGVSDSVTVGQRSLAVETTTDTVLVESDAILYSAHVTLK